MAVKASGKGDVYFPPLRGWTPDRPWARPCIVDECQQEHAPTGCTLFKNKSPEDRLQEQEPGGQALRARARRTGFKSKSPEDRL
jgi:hypothetical protein